MKKRKNSFKLQTFKSIISIKMLKKSLTWERTLNQTSLQLSKILKKTASNNVSMNTDKNCQCLNMEFKKNKIISKWSPLMINKCFQIKFLNSKLQWNKSGNKSLNPIKTQIMSNNIKIKIKKINPVTETTKIKEVNCFLNTQIQVLLKTCTICYQSQVYSKCKGKDKELLDTCLETKTKMERKLFQFHLHNSKKSDS